MINFQDFIVDLNNFSKKQFIGEGRFGNVFLIEEKDTQKKFAAKIMIKKCTDTEELKLFFNQIKLHLEVSHPVMLKFIGYNVLNLDSEPYPTIIVDFMPNKSLEYFLNLEKKAIVPAEFSDTVKYQILFGIALGMKHLHSKKLVHRDLKPDNIILDENYYPRICDFDLSKMADEQLKKFCMKSQVGTPLYMAPEIFTGSERENFQTSLLREKENRDFLEACHSINPSERPDFSDICQFIVQKKFLSEFSIIDIDEVQNFFDFLEDDIDSLFLRGKFNYYNNVEDTIEKNEIYKGEQNIVYSLSTKSQTAKIIESPLVKYKVTVPAFVTSQSKKYVVTEISDNAFSGSAIVSLSFKDNSHVLSIGKNVFAKSTISSFFIPESLEKLDNDAFKDAEQLNQVEVNINNKNFSIENDCLVFKTNKKINDSTIELKEVIYSPHNFVGQFVVPKRVTKIKSNSFSNRQGLNSIKSEEKSLKEIESYSFYNCNKLENILINQSKFLNIGSFCFAKSNKLLSIEIDSEEVNIGENCFENSV